MIQIGLHNTGYFSAASLFIDGTIVYASPEERLSRIKYDNRFPWRSIQAALGLSNLTLDDVDEFIVSWNPFINAAGRHRAGFSQWVPHPMQRLFSNVNQVLPRLSGRDSEIGISEEIIRYRGGKDLRFLFVNHHLAHAGLSVYTSPFTECAVAIADGYGEKGSTMLYRYSRDNGFTLLKQIDFPHSLGLMYSTFTEFIGFAPDKDEWKFMGAAAYGNADVYYDRVKRLVSINDQGDYELDLSYFDFYNFDTPNTFTRKFAQLFGEPNREPLPSRRDYDLAAAVQVVFEEIVLKMLRWLAAETNTDNLCLGGGSFMNTLLNGKVSRETPFKNVFIPFSPDDAGNAIGAPMYLNKQATPFLMPYLSENITEETIAESLRKYNIKFSSYPESDLLQFIAARLAEQKIVGWFQGAMEFGQRALGNRSIVASPQHPSMKDTLNKAVKYREHFRPFAPAVLHGQGDRFFQDYVYSPYMERVQNFLPHSAGQVAAVVHADGTGRTQSVTEHSNAKFYNLIEAFEKISGIPILLNTSFNRAGEPIVCTPDDGLRTFFTSGIDILVMGNTVIEK